MDVQANPRTASSRCSSRKVAGVRCIASSSQFTATIDGMITLFFHLSSKVKVLATAEKIRLQIIRTAGEVLNLASFVARCTWHFFHSFFLFFFSHKALRARPKQSWNAPCSHRLPFITLAIVWRLNSQVLFPVRFVWTVRPLLTACSKYEWRILDEIIPRKMARDKATYQPEILLCTLRKWYSSTLINTTQSGVSHSDPWPFWIQCWVARINTFWGTFLIFHQYFHPYLACFPLNQLLRKPELRGFLCFMWRNSRFVPVRFLWDTLTFFKPNPTRWHNCKMHCWCTSGLPGYKISPGADFFFFF